MRSLLRKAVLTALAILLTACYEKRPSPEPVPGPQSVHPAPAEPCPHGRLFRL
jgi:hypothetical protein